MTSSLTDFRKIPIFREIQLVESAIARPQSSVGRPMHNLHFDDDDTEQGNQSGGSGLSGLAIGTGIGKEDSNIQF